MEQKFIQCPKCESKAIQQRSGVGLAMFFLLVGIITLLAGVVFFPLWIITFSSFIIFPFMLLIPKRLHCLHCHYVFKNEKNEPKQPGI